LFQSILNKVLPVPWDRADRRAAVASLLHSAPVLRDLLVAAADITQSAFERLSPN